MKKCPTCGHVTKTKRDELNGNVFAGTVVSLTLSSIVLFESEWTLAWWSERLTLMLVFAVVPVITGYFWVQWFRSRRSSCR